MIKFIEDFHRLLDGNDYYPAWNRAMSSAAAGETPRPGGFSIYFANKTYRFSQTISLIRGMSLIGSGGAGWYGGTIFQFDAGLSGMVCAYDPAPASAAHVPQTGEWSIVERIAIRGAPNAGVVNHGISMFGRMTVRDCYIRGFNGNGILIQATSDQPALPVRVANNWIISNVRIDNCEGDGLFVDGSDVNAGCATQLDSSENGGWGIRDNSFLGNTYVACHTSGNALGAYTTRTPEGGSKANATSTFIGCYEESGQGTGSRIDDPSLVIGGNVNLSGAVEGVANDSTAVRMTSSRGMAYFENGVLGSGRKQLGISAMLGSTEDFGGQPGAALTFSDGGPWPYRLHGPTNDWWELKWAEQPDAPIRFSTETVGEEPPAAVPGGQVWFEKGFYLGAYPGSRFRLMAGAGPPAAGDFSVGDRVLNAAPARGAYEGWVCVQATTADLAAQWEPYGMIG